MHNATIVVRAAAVVCFAAILGGCAFGQKITYSNTTADIEAKGNKSVAVAVHDERSYVVTGDKQPSFVGLSRGGFGNPFDILTTSGAPLANEMASSVVRSLSERGFKASAVQVAPSQSRRATMDQLHGSGAERRVLIALKEWKSDKYVRTSLTYDVTVKVSDAAGEEIATATFNGDEPIGDVQAAFRSKIEQWFGDQKIVAALK
jgi:hypothetical protein